VVARFTKIWNYGKKGPGDYIFDAFNVLFLFFLMLVTLYPFIYVLYASISDPVRMMAHSGLLFRPLGFQLRGYGIVLENVAVKNGYLVTLFIVTAGTLSSMAASVLFAYVLSRKNLMFHRFITFTAIFTMYFSGGMIPLFLVVRGLRLLDNLWSLILPGLISTYNVIILRTAFNTIPNEMEESAKLDGAGSIRTLAAILIPLIMPTIAAISLFYMVGYWNSWTAASIYLKTPQKFPLQLVLRAILMRGEMTESTGGSSMAYEASVDDALVQLIKYCTMIVTMIPIVVVYPFIQKFFTKGVMIGAIKG
jgi:putative aldouronate transport system permease protein